MNRSIAIKETFETTDAHHVVNAIHGGILINELFNSYKQVFTSVVNFHFFQASLQLLHMVQYFDIRCVHSGMTITHTIIYLPITKL